MKKVLTVSNLSIGYSQKRSEKVVAEGINVDLFKGELVCLLGPNGAGKSTLMRTISGTQNPLKGEIFLDQRNIHKLPSKELAKSLSLVLTEKVHAGMLTAYEVVALGRYPHVNWTGRLNDKDHEIIQWAIRMSGANELADRVLTELSDGERQKIMVARALAQEPEVMILDEVTAFLDLPRRIEIMHLLKDLAHNTNKAVLLSTHDMDLALRNADKLWLLSKGGQFEEGAPEDLVLNGTLGSAFSSEGVVFNRENGSFVFANQANFTVNLMAKGELLFWTTRALERAGYSIDKNAEFQIEAKQENGQNKWTISSKEDSIDTTTIYELIDTLQQKVTHQSSSSN